MEKHLPILVMRLLVDWSCKRFVASSSCTPTPLAVPPASIHQRLACCGSVELCVVSGLCAIP
ncbi:unnamed protein product, partial [Timema podura]|nr:unnamed protein product [Timema podura]